MKAQSLRYTVKCWCAESGAEGEYEFKDRSRVDAIEKAAQAFQDDCRSAAARYVPPRPNRGCRGAPVKTELKRGRGKVLSA